MNFEEEITLLIKSRYPLVLVDTIDEDYILKALYSISENLSFGFYSWSLTKGLRVGKNENSFYHSSDPATMLKLAGDILKDGSRAIFVLSDLNKFLEDAVVARLFKDLLSAIQGTPTTLVLLGSEQKIPPDIASSAARISGGYPDESEITAEINRTVADFKTSAVHVSVDLSAEDLARMVRGLKGLSLQQIRNILNVCITKDNILNIADLAEIDRFKKEAFDRDGILEYFGSEPDSAMAGYVNLKRWLNERKRSFLPDAPANLPPPKGILLLGVQGCGKSLAAKVAAGALGLPLYRLDLNRLYSKYIGETEENLRKALKTVESLSPVCLWIDEIEKIFAASSGEIDGGVSQRVLGEMLTWMQERSDRSFIAATSNNIDNLPPELLRKGRFDEIFFADLPDATARQEIFRVHLAKRGLQAAAFDAGQLALASEGFSGAEIEQAVISALYSASGSGKDISTGGILEQLRLTRPLSVVKSESVNALRDWAKERAMLPV